MPWVSWHQWLKNSSRATGDPLIWSRKNDGGKCNIVRTLVHIVQWNQQYCPRTSTSLARLRLFKSGVMLTVSNICLGIYPEQSRFDVAAWHSGEVETTWLRRWAFVVYYKIYDFWLWIKYDCSENKDTNFLKPRANIWASAWQNLQSGINAPSEDSNQPWHPPSLIRVFAVRSMGS